MLVDGCPYFSALDAAFRQATRSIVILGWDFDGRIRLTPQGDEDLPLGELLRRCVELQPDLHVHILVWSTSVVHGPSAIAPNVIGAGWEDHPRIHFKLDTHHPFYAAHHQKIVCIDGRLAFVGGIDLTVRRWDCGTHAPGLPARCDPDGRPYGPVHDIQMLVDGEAAEALCVLAEERWRLATGEGYARPAVTAELDPWPDGLEPDFEDVPIAIARTVPTYGGAQEIAECAQLTLDMIAAARHAIYIEAQYLSSRLIGAALEKRLREPDGPDVVVIMTYQSRGVMERFAMTSNRDRLLRRLGKADRRGRLRALYPVVPDGDGEEQVLIHSKLVIADDRLLRIGSSNLNNRSIALDTECDLAIEGTSREERRAIAGLRNRLLAEHLAASAQEVTSAIASTGRLVPAIDRLNGKRRGLRPFPALTDGGPSRPLLGTALIDPTRPFSLSSLFRRRGRSLSASGAR
ncbi:phospholipase D-like domain-containing protein [Bosea thiooxidans]